MNTEEQLNRHYPDGEPIAVIGYAGRFPDAADSDAYWANLLAGRECNRQFSRRELLDAGISAAVIDDPAYVPCGTVVPGADTFDAELFGYSRQEAELIDPQQRLFLQIAWHALEHAGYAPGAVPHKTGVFGSGRISTYPGREAIDIAGVAHVRSLQSLMGNDKDYVATRVAYKLNLHGPAISVQTACSSSLVAIHMACESLRAGECDMAIAGGVAVSFPQVSGYLYQPGMIFSPDGHCRPFDVQAGGTYSGNGAAAVVLRRLPDALRDGDPIAALVPGSAINNDGGRKVGYTAPSAAGQREVIADAWSLAGVSSRQFGMIEAHGTATPLGDSIELQALHSVFHANGQGPRCALGSVKSNIGHLDTAAGIAGFLKAVMAVERGVIPPCVNFLRANPDLNLENGPFCVPAGALPWDVPDRLAGVSSFGIGGTNCHVVVASLPPDLQPPPQPDVTAGATLLLSANSEDTLRRLAGAYAQALQTQPAADLVCTALTGRRLDLPWRLAVPVCDETIGALNTVASGGDDTLVQMGHSMAGKRVWLFTGQGCQWSGMARTWCETSTAFAQCLERCLAASGNGDRAFSGALRQALMEPDSRLLRHMEYAQPAIVAFELAMAAHWQAQGLMPDIVLGHSVGEFAAAVVAGYYSHEQIMPVVRQRGALMDRCSGGAMLSVFADEARVLPAAARLGLDLAACNGGQHLVFSGERGQVTTFAAGLENIGVRSNLLAVTGAAHSRMLDPILDEFGRVAGRLQAQDGTIMLISGLTGDIADSSQLNQPDFWQRHMRHPVRFIQSLRKALENGANLFLEMGPDALLTGIGQHELGNAAHWIAGARRAQPAQHSLNRALMQLFATGIDLPRSALPGGSGRKCRAPLYPFALQRYWREAPAVAAGSPLLPETHLPEACNVADRLPGRALTNDGDYLADWSDCAGRKAPWQDRIVQACREMARRHGDVRKVPVVNVSARAPDWLSLVRLQWQAVLMQPARIDLTLLAPDGTWQKPVAAPAADNSRLPLLTATPETHYDWCWERAEPASGNAFHSRFCLAGQTGGSLAAELGQAGISLTDKAGDTLLVLPAATRPEDIAGVMFNALANHKSGRILIVTRSAWALDEGEIADAVHHAAWGLARSIAQDPGRAITVVDLAATAPWQDLMIALQSMPDHRQWLAVRRGQALTPRLQSHQYAAAELDEQSLQGNGWHVITGGLGGLGRLSAAWLAGRGAQRIALLVRRRHDDTADFTAYLHQCYGVTVTCLICDVADMMALNVVLNRLQADGGVAGVIHAAGIPDGSLFPAGSADQPATVLAVKAHAARTIYDRLREAGNPSYLLLYSSAAAALGSTGQTGYALASGYLDGLAYEAATDDNPVRVTSVGWGAWGETGMAADKSLQKAFASEGMGTLSDAEGLWHLEQALSRGSAYRLAMRVLPGRINADRRRLLQMPEQTPPPAAITAQAQTMDLPADKLTDPGEAAQWLSAQIAAQLRPDNPAHLSPDRDLVQLGLDSLRFLELSNTIQRRLGVRIDAAQAYQDLTINGLSRLIAAQPAQNPGSPQQPAWLQHDAPGRFLPFPLTPIQHAYWMGRTSLIDYGGVACGVLFEWDLHRDQFDPARLEHAWNALIHRHDMLRMVIDGDGQQRVLKDVPEYRIGRRDLSALTADEREQRLADTRRELSCRVMPADRWPLFRLIITDQDSECCRLHMNLDLLLFDVQSFRVMMDDLAALYHGDSPAPLPITFRDYVLNDQKHRRSGEWLKSWCYWQNLLPDLPPAPKLPLSKHDLTGRQPDFTTYQAVLDRTSWGRLKQEWQSRGVTPSAALMTLFAATLRRWARWPAFTLNLTFFNRRPVHPQINRLIGDFTSVLLIDFDLSDPSVTLHQAIERTRQRLRRRLAHSGVNGVELLREMGRIRGQTHQPLMPVVFTSMLGMTPDSQTTDQAMTSLLGDPVHVCTQTPQVWLDHQVMEINGELVVNWYCMDGVLAGNTAQQMFGDFRNLLQAVASDPQRMGQRKLRNIHELQPPVHHGWPAVSAGSKPDPRDIEAAACRQDGVLLADVRQHDSPDGLLLKVVAAQREYTLSNLPGLTPEILPDPAGLNDAEQQAFDTVWTALEARALQGIAATLTRHGLFTQAHQTADQDSICRRLKVLPQFERIVRQWLRALCSTGWLYQDGRNFVCLQPLSRVPSPPAAPASVWGDTLSAYLDRSIERHTQLLQGTCPALELFFTDDDAVTRALYAENPAAQCVTRNVEYIVRALSQSDETTDGLRALEVGAGTGATTGAVLNALGKHLHSYHYTDVSVLFLDDARKRFAARDDLTYGIFDINQPVDYTQHPPGGYDLVIAAQVMHDAGHIVRSLRRIGSLMRPGARLVLIETTHSDSLLQMASVGFIEGLGNYRDERVIDDRAMPDLSQWREALHNGGFSPELIWPETETSPIHQHVIVARLVRAAHVDCVAVKQALERHFDGVLPSLEVRQSELQDMFTPDHPCPPEQPPAQSPDATAPVIPAGDALMNSVAQVWQTFLGRPVHPACDFFRCGGDSLIATRVIAQLNRNGVAGASLQALFTRRTLGAFCATLRETAAADMENVLVQLTPGTTDERLFVFHASDGGVTSYLAFARSLDAQVWGLQAPEQISADSLSALASGYLHAMQVQPGHAPVTLVGWSYGAAVAAEIARILHDRGRAVRLVLIDPVSGAGFAVADLSALMVMLSDEHKITLPDNWNRLDESTRIRAFVSGAAETGVIDETLSAADAHQWLTRIFRLLNLLPAHRIGSPVPVPVFWIEADSHSGQQKTAECEWADWKAHAQTLVVRATHRQLMEDESVAVTLGRQVQQWLFSRNSHRGDVT
ncbi:SDR family NAD(P)-dependent oxidoreductase [Morganella morganii]|uniref:SDR family NAD(P)-dependent oxidoreductase n=1 Tax=Morganella morganii TaxID=582 RepID=UPI003B9E5FC9